MGGRCLLPLADVPRQYGAPRDHGPDERGEERLRRGAHALIVRTAAVGARGRAGCSPSVHEAFTGRPHLVTLAAYAVRMREAFHEQLDSIFHDLAEICDAVETSVRLATQALL